ncbi:phosphate transport system protein [Marinitoga hydrogenitolerans DSM 16785]|uniref:Phosphate transport system protein n=1 Tax=Marinitoga hydrogenitolerans (strain DSM 16785 / JCM 12826 / AT1271) TaxID=1122195 RepID=A0A1M4SZ03_MARH1|nr:PhoU domain-containing protein [Marinitoga hydrogenitolerans]SHE37488.1 phosphate transport system protein [Marinitoga hydrogenitolerans DSM 16785]
MIELLSEETKKQVISYHNEILKMGRLVQGMFLKFKDAFFEKNVDLSREIIKQDMRVDFIEARLEYKSMEILAINNLYGIYFKIVFLGNKIIGILESMADLCETMAKNNIDLLSYPNSINPYQFEDLFDISQNMLGESLRLFSNIVENRDLYMEKDAIELAKIICKTDIEVDSLYNAFKRNLMGKVTKDNFKSIMANIEILSNLEKFSDLTTNIAEYSIFILTGDRYKCNKEGFDIFYSLGE